MKEISIKICGLTQEKDISAAVNLGIDFLGFVIVKGSSRYVSINSLKKLVKYIPSSISTVALLVNPENDILELSINAGAEDCISIGQNHEIITEKSSFYKVKINIEKKIREFISLGIEWMPLNKISLDKEKTKSVLNFLEALEDNDDVQHVYANLEIESNLSEEINT